MIENNIHLTEMYSCEVSESSYFGDSPFDIIFQDTSSGDIEKMAFCSYSEYIDEVYYSDNLWKCLAVCADLRNNFDDFLDTDRPLSIEGTPEVSKLFLAQSILTQDWISFCREEPTEDEWYVHDNIFNYFTDLLDTVLVKDSYINFKKYPKELCQQVAEVYIFCNKYHQDLYTNLISIFPDLVKKFTLLDELAPYLTTYTYLECHAKYSNIIQELQNRHSEIPLVALSNVDNILATNINTKAPEYCPQYNSTINTPMSEPLQKEPIMTTKLQTAIDTTVAVHKDSLQTAASIEAGNIALNFLTERLKDILPSQAKLVLYLPGSELLVATIATVAINTFSPGNKKALIASRAMTTAAYGKLFAKINITKLIEDVVDKIPMDMFTTIEDGSNV